MPEHLLEMVDELIRQGHTVRAACSKVGVSQASYRRARPQVAEYASARERLEADRAKVRESRRTKAAAEGGPKEREGLSPEAKQAYDDFAVFRRRYFGRVSMPWQVDAANRILEELSTPEKSYVVMNAPPGTGKSTLMHDMACWLIARRRNIRILMVSATGKMVRYYGRRLKSSLERTFPYMADDEDKARGLATDAEAVLPEDFGRFKPLKGVWRDDEFIVEQLDGHTGDEKEPTFGAFGLDEENIGFRADVILTDDAFTLDNSRDGPRRDNALDRWDKVVEKRLEPGGVCLVFGQRLGPLDGYRHCLDKKVISGGEARPKYKHILYKAHYEDLCPDPQWDHHGCKPWPDGCLLDPVRLTWQECVSLRHEDMVTWEVVYQQEDVGVGNRLVEPAWVYGGEVDGVTFPGCLDMHRPIGQWPDPAELSERWVSYGVVDPSGVKQWGIEWRVFDVERQVHHVVDIYWQRMTAEEMLGYDTRRQRHIGLMDELQRRSEQSPYPITLWVVEQNAAQRFLLQHQFVSEWRTRHRVHIQPHTSSANKVDVDLGVEALVPTAYRLGLVRLPYRNNARRWLVEEKVAQLMEWTRSKRKRTDLVMTEWFALVWAPRFAPSRRRVSGHRPSWLISARVDRRLLLARRR